MFAAHTANQPNIGMKTNIIDAAYKHTIPNHIIINDKLKKYCGNTLSSRDDAYIIFLIVANHVKSYSVIGRDDVLFFKLPHYKGISMEKELYMDRNRFVYE